MSFFIANEFRLLFGKEKLSFTDTTWDLPYKEKIDKQFIMEANEV